MFKFLRRRWLIVLHDLAWVPVAIILAFWLRHNLGWIPLDSWGLLATLVAIALPVHALTFWLAGCFRGIWRFASIPDFIRFFGAIGGGGIATAILFGLVRGSETAVGTVLVLYPIFLLLGSVGARVFYRVVLESWVHDDDTARALIIGAGQAGNLLIRDLLSNGPFKPVGILDDDRAKMGIELHGVRVRGRLSALERLAKQLNVAAVLVAMPSAPKATLNRVVSQSAKLGIKCRMLPSLAELADGKVMVSDLRPVTVEDLLGREPIRLDAGSVEGFVRGKTVMVTGGGGSIGSELCRQIVALEPDKLVVLEQGEFNLYQIDHELRGKLHPSRIVARLGDCKNPQSVERLMALVRPDVVFHAAAYKHVPLVEDNVIEGVANNVLGTKVVADLAVKYGVGTFVLISTDKTVNPTNYMGASKRIAEMYCQSRNRESGTHFITTRFGNVLASAGSVVPLFEAQIRSGGPVTVTHPDIARYFMTIPEAVSLILQAGAMGKGGEIFVLDMGELVRIRDLAEKMIQLSGLEPDRDIKIEYTGLRPGEKLFEELFYESEVLGKTAHPKLLLANSSATDSGRLDAVITRLENALTAGSVSKVHSAVVEIVPEFRRNPPPDGDDTITRKLKLVK